MKQTQAEMILDYMKKYGSITQLEATSELGVVRLPSRIFDLRQDGIPIAGKMIAVKNRHGGTSHVMQYSLEDEG